MTDWCGLLLLNQVALSSFHNRGVRTHEGHSVLLDLITEEQGTPRFRENYYLGFCSVETNKYSECLPSVCCIITFYSGDSHAYLTIQKHICTTFKLVFCM